MMILEYRALTPEFSVVCWFSRVCGNTRCIKYCFDVGCAALGSGGLHAPMDFNAASLRASFSIPNMPFGWHINTSLGRPDEPILLLLPLLASFTFHGS